MVQNRNVAQGALARIAVAVPTIAEGRERLDRCVAAILSQRGVQTDVTLVENGPGSAAACAEWEARGVAIVRPGRNLGVAATWNHAARMAWSSGHDAVLLLNDDVLLSDDASLAVVRAAADRDPRRLYFLNATRFAAFCVTRTIWDEVGEFDEGFWPAYFEDLDWQRRALLREVPWEELGLAAEHVGGATRLADPALQRLVEHTWPLNAQRYEAKWGGPPDAERHAVAWDAGLAHPGSRELLGDPPVQRSLDLGCGQTPRGPWGWERWGVDLIADATSGIVQADLALEPIPFPAGHFERVFAYDFLEHVPMRAYVCEPQGKPRTINAMIELFNEVARVLAPGGVFESLTPHLPHWQEMFRDPTHVSFWTEQTWEYLSTNGELLPWGRRYGLVADFELVRKEWRGPHMYVELLRH
jgi:SAM-dependent methyltransferase